MEEGWNVLKKKISQILHKRGSSINDISIPRVFLKATSTQVDLKYVKTLDTLFN